MIKIKFMSCALKIKSLIKILFRQQNYIHFFLGIIAFLFVFVPYSSAQNMPANSLYTELSNNPLFAEEDTSLAYDLIDQNAITPAKKYSMTEISEMQQELVKITSELVAIPSSSMNLAACARIIDYVHNLFGDTGYNITRIENNGVHSIIISKKNDLNFDVLFLGHLDVVHNPDLSSYSPSLQAQTLHGRGISDMKAAAAGMMKLFLDNEDNPQFENYGLVFTTDEQLGGFNGTAHLVQEHGLKAKVVFNPDGGHPLNPSVSEKGVLQIKITAKGKAAHGSRPWEGDSAIEMLLGDIDHLKMLFDYGSMENQKNITLNIGTINGGEATNAVSVNADATIDIRFPPTLTKDEIILKIKSGLQNSQVEILAEADPVAIKPNDEALLDLMKALIAQGRQPSLMHETGGCDARWFMPQGSSILLMRLEGTGGLVDDEYVTIEGLSNYYLVMESFLNEVADNF